MGFAIQLQVYGHLIPKLYNYHICIYYTSLLIKPPLLQNFNKSPVFRPKVPSLTHFGPFLGKNCNKLTPKIPFFISSLSFCFRYSYTEMADWQLKSTYMFMHIFFDESCHVNYNLCTITAN